jgi:hypothetical protein
VLTTWAGQRFWVTRLSLDKRGQVVNLLVVVMVAAIMITAPQVAWAYVGPGAGLGMIGSLIAVLGAIVVALVGLVILPFRMLLKRRKARAGSGQEPAAAGAQDG